MNWRNPEVERAMYLRGLRKVADNYGAVLVGEVYANSIGGALSHAAWDADYVLR